jgi:hypothetical protein
MVFGEPLDLDTDNAPWPGFAVPKNIEPLESPET